MKLTRPLQDTDVPVAEVPEVAIALVSHSFGFDYHHR